MGVVGLTEICTQTVENATSLCMCGFFVACKELITLAIATIPTKFLNCLRSMQVEYLNSNHVQCLCTIHIGICIVLHTSCKGRDSSVGVVTGYGMGGRVSVPGRGKIFFSPYRPDRLCGLPSILSKGYWDFFP
jgi:hypothetical protein